MFYFLFHSCLETLPNELFLLVFSYLKSDMIIQAFLNLNQRFQSLIFQYVRHLALPLDIHPNWIKENMFSIHNEIETIKLSVNLIASVFSNTYSYSNLRLITLYFNDKWQVELNVENDFPFAAIVSSLNVLAKCSFEGTQQFITQPVGSSQVTKGKAINISFR